MKIGSSSPLEAALCSTTQIPRIVLLFGMGLTLTASHGCGGADRLEVAQVRGKVVSNGIGVPQAVVIFHPGSDVPDNGKKLRPFAYADADGNFVLKTYVEGDGAPPGTYRVSIVAGSGGGSRKDRPVSEENVLPIARINIPPDIAKKYADVETSGIQVTVKDGENNLEPFELK